MSYFSRFFYCNSKPPFLFCQMHEFFITKDAEDKDIDIYGLHKDMGKEGEAMWKLLPTSVTAKPNSQIAESSPKLWLLRSLPNECNMPLGTPKFHLFRKLSRDKKPIEQTPAELEKKLKALKKTVKEASHLKQFDEEDKSWWDNFWSVRSQTRDRLGDGEEEDRTPDVTSIALVRKLLWPDPGAAAEPVTTDDEEQVVEATPVVGPLHDLQLVLTPRTSPATADEFGRARKTGFITVGPNQDRAECFAEARNRRTVVKDNFC